MKHHITDTYVPSASPSQEELRAIVGHSLYPVCNAVRDYIHVRFGLGEMWRYSHKRDAFDCLFLKEDAPSPLCSLHAVQGTLSVLILMNEEDCEAFRKQYNDFSEAVRVLFDAAAIFDGEKWLRVMIDSSASLEELFPILSFMAPRYLA